MSLFVIAIGGTGMRCLESFVHLCAIGMFDNQEIEILTLDTDQNNGNMARVWELIDLYNRIKSVPGNSNGGTPNTDTFFSAKLNLYKFYTNYDSQARITYRNISRLTEGGSQDDIRQNQMLSDLFLERETVQDFKLDNGYRAQTHLGSHLMYHGIIEAARRLLRNENVGTAERDLEAFLAKLQTASDTRAFVFGSVFGGTGASSIPIIPVAFKDAISIRSEGREVLDLNRIKFGSTLLTEYFSFNKPDLTQLNSEEGKVIADSRFFSINSQAALQFYQNDPTVQSVYKRMYHIGWPLESKPINNNDRETITGGANQKNHCHIVELMCACAAYDFFTETREFNARKSEYLFRSIEYDNGTFNFSGKDFVGDQNNAGEVFTNKLGAFLSLAHISLSRNKAAWGDKGIKGFLIQLQQNKINTYDTITDDETIEIDNYLKMFAYTFDSNKNFVPGWLFQVRQSVLPGKFIFNNNAFKETWKELERMDVGALFLDEKHHWEKSLFSDRYNTFVKIFTNSGQPSDRQKVTTTKERFLAHIYNGITISQKFNL